MTPEQIDVSDVVLNKVTWHSQTAAIVLFVGVFGLGLYLGGIKSELEQSSSHFTEDTNSVSNKSMSSINQSSDLPAFIFKYFPHVPRSQAEISFAGLLTPVELHMGWNTFKESTINVRCWKSTNECIVRGKFADPRYVSPAEEGNWVAIAKITEWNDTEIKAEGLEGYPPDCEKDLCGNPFNFTVDINAKVVRFTHTQCWQGCATDIYQVVGRGDGIHKTKADLPIPTELLTPII